MPKGQRPVLSVEQQRAIKSLTFHAAQDAFHIGFQTWKAIREADGFLPFRGDGDALAEIEESVLQSVREKPHLATGVRARELGIGTGAVQTVPVRRKLAKLHARLEFAGYRVEACRPLEVARQRRILATYPGALTHIGFKTFGYLRSPRGQAQQHEVPFALVMERRAKGTFEAELREPPGQGATSLSRPDPDVTLAKWARPVSPRRGG